jgi:histidinol-phosphate phosphatase family protein
VLCDRDGTLVADVPYNGDPDRVVPLPGVVDALERVRAAGLALAVVTNQSGLALGRFSESDLAAVHRRVVEVLGRFELFASCPHGPLDGCGCRKPAPGLVRAAAMVLNVPPSACVVIGDTGADVGAARAAGARAILVPNAVTRREEIELAPVVAGCFSEAVDLALGWR